MCKDFETKAFPGPNSEQPGMDLRDWFAGKALSGLLAKNREPVSEENEKQLSFRSYALADLMMEARTLDISFVKNIEVESEEVIPENE